MSYPPGLWNAYLLPRKTTKNGMTTLSCGPWQVPMIPKTRPSLMSTRSMAPYLAWWSVEFRLLWSNMAGKSLEFPCKWRFKTNQHILYPLVNYHNYGKIHHFQWINPLCLWPFYSSVSSPDGNWLGSSMIGDVQLPRLIAREWTEDLRRLQSWGNNISKHTGPICASKSARPDKNRNHTTSWLFFTNLNDKWHYLAKHNKWHWRNKQQAASVYYWIHLNS